MYQTSASAFGTESCPATIREFCDPLRIWKLSFSFWINIYMLYGGQLPLMPRAN
jgi:hypothetical protein